MAGHDDRSFDGNRVALVSPERECRYDELRRESLRYGNALRAAGADVAPLLVDQSIESVFLYLGALQACRRVIPLGVNLLRHDPARFRPFLERHGLFATRRDWAQLESRLTAKSLAARIIEPTSQRAVWGGPHAPLLGTAELVLHTSSSSTAHTKAVLISTEYLPLFFSWCERSFGLTDQDRFLWASPLHFDMSFFDFFLPLALGAAVVIPPAGALFYPDRLIGLLKEHQVTVTHSVPSFWHGLAVRGSGNPSSTPMPSALRNILVAGDILPHFILGRLRSAFPHADVFNFYGQTEANSYLYQRIESDRDIAFPPGLGRTESYAKVSVLTAEGLGEDGLGTLVVNGPNVAAGYLADDYETVQPLSATLGPGYFPTGDFVHMHHGRVDFHGRAGSEIHVGGRSRQTLELRTQCNAIPGVVQSVVVGTPDGPVLIAEPAPGVDADTLLATIRRIIPIPVRVRPFFPLNYNGKVDLQRLAAGDG